MKTAITASNPGKKIPPFSALLLALALFFSVAAWSVMKSNPDETRHPVSPEAVPSELSISHSAKVGARYQAQRHQAVAVESSSRVHRQEEQSRAEFGLRGPVTRPEADRREGVWN